MSLTQVSGAGTATDVALDSDLDAISSVTTDNQRRIISLEEAMGNVESWDWIQMSTNYTCGNVPVQKIYPTVSGLTLTLPAHGVGRKVQILISDVTMTVKATTGSILTRGGGSVAQTTINNKGEYEYVSDGTNWIDQSSASRIESESVQYMDATGQLIASGKKYILNVSAAFYLPNPSNLSRGDTVTFESSRGVTPTVSTHASTTVINTASGDMTQIVMDMPGEEVTLIWNLTKWVLN